MKSESQKSHSPRPHFLVAARRFIFTVLLLMAKAVFAVDANLVVTGFSSFQPTTIAPLGRPNSITYTLQNFGPGSLGNSSGGTGPVLVDLWLSSNTSYGDGDDRHLGTMQFSITATAGSSGAYTHSNPGGLSGFNIPSYANGVYHVFLRVVPAPASGLNDPNWSDNYALLPSTIAVTGSDVTRPTVTSIGRWNPPFQTNNAQFVTWLVSFSEQVAGVDLSDFTLVDVNGGVVGEFLGNVSTSSGSQVLVTANTGSGGAGELRLDVIYPGATITNFAANALTNSFTTGQVYTVDKVPPTVVSINRHDPAEQTTSATSVVYRVTFSEPVMGVATDDFTLVDVSGTINGASITSVSSSSGTIIDVAVNTGSGGNGDLRLDVSVPGATITDATGNSLNQNFTSGEAYSIDRTAPVVNSFSPADGAVGVAWDTDLVITFSEPAVKGAGNIVIKKSSDDSVVEMIPVTNAQVTVVGDVATIDPTSDLTSETGYYVRIDSGAFEDLAGNDYAGISDKTTWNFTTADTTPPTVINVSPFFTGGTLAVGASSLRIAFSKPVTGGDLAENYQLQSIGPDALLGTADDAIVPVSASYADTTVTLGFAALPASVYRLTVRDTITDGSGIALDGNGDGVASGNWVKDFVVLSYDNDLFGSTTTSDTGGTFPVDVVVGEFNGDGRQDIAVANRAVSNGLAVMLGDGNGGFANPAIYYSGGYSHCVAVGDFNRDGFQDFAVGNWVNNITGSVGILLGRGDGTFGVATTYSSGGNSPDDLLVVDFNADGSQDLALANPYGWWSDGVNEYSVPGMVGVMLGRGDGTFAPVVTFDLGGSYATSIDVGDFDEDGHRDLVVAKGEGGGTIGVLLGHGDGSFDQAATYQPGYYNNSVSVADFDSDGHQDLAVVDWGNASARVKVMLGRGDGTFNGAVPYSPGGTYTECVSVGDFDGDGRIDLAVSNGNGGQDGTVGVLLGHGDGTFATPVTFSSGGKYPRARPAVGDFNRDGRPDVVVVNESTRTLGVLLNSSSAETGLLLSPKGHVFDVQSKGFMAGQLVQGSYNVFDGLNRLQVSGADYAPTANSAMHDDGRTVVTGTHNLAGLNVHREITVTATGNEDFGRIVDVFENPTGTAITTTVRIVGNLGSDAATTVFATSDGDTVIETGDQWIGTDDGDGTGTPAIVHYMHGPAGIQPTSVIRTGDNIEWTYHLTVPAGQTARLAHSTVLSEHRTDAIAAAYALVTPSSFGGQAAVFLTQTELDSLANFVFDQTPPNLVSVSPVSSVIEGNSASTALNFAVTLGPTSSVPVTVDFATADGSATVVNNDYVPTNGALTFAPGESNKTITVFVHGDTKVEPNETFFVLVSNATNAIISSAQATGTILNDDSPQQSMWQSVSIPDLPADSRLGAVWARTRTEAYVWASLTSSPLSFLFRWDGATWGQVLALTNHSPGKIFGTGPSEVFVSANYYSNGLANPSFARVFRSTDNGTNWSQQVLPATVANSELGNGYFGGTENNVHLQVGTGNILRFDGTNWNLIFTETTRGIYGLALVGTNEGYYVTCNDWGSWDGINWIYRGNGDVGCDVYGGVWGMRTYGGPLSLYAVGQNNFNNGVRVWGFNETNQTWGQVFSDGPGGAGTGNGNGVWGSAPDDVYVVGELISGPTHSGRVYRFDGISWTQVTAVGSISTPGGVTGSASDDIWISLRDEGKMLHLTPPASPALSISLVSTNVILTWPGSAIGYTLVTAGSLVSPINWTAVTNVPLLISNRFEVTLSNTNANQYFRLTKQP